MLDQRLIAGNFLLLLLFMSYYLSRLIGDSSKQGIIVNVKPGYLAEIESQPQLSQVVKYIHQQIAAINRILPMVLANPELFERLKNSTLQIQIVAGNDRDLTQNMVEGPTARYLPSRNTIFIVQDSDWTDVELKQTLGNELHHVLNFQTNKAKQTPFDLEKMKKQDSSRLLFPFIQNLWKQDNVLLKQHRHALEAAHARIMAFKAAIDRPGNNDPEYLKLLDRFNNYQPQVSSIQVPREIAGQFTKSLEPIKNGRQRLAVEGSTAEPIYVFKTKLYSNVFIIKYTCAASDSGLDKARAFIRDYSIMWESIYTGAYANFKQAHKEMELSSFIEQLDPTVKETFFKEWCDYFASYHGVGNYCAKP